VSYTEERTDAPHDATPPQAAAKKKKKASRRKYSRAASGKVERAMHEMKRGQLRSGRSKRKVKSKKQAIAIGLSEARRGGAKVPAKRKRASAKKKRS
jgi:hypothetical protein